MRNVGTLPMTTRCLDCHKKQGNVAGGAGLLWFAGSLEEHDPLILDLTSGKKHWFVSMPDVVHLNEVHQEDHQRPIKTRSVCSQSALSRNGSRRATID